MSLEISFYGNYLHCLFFFRDELIIPDDSEECELVEIEVNRRRHNHESYEEDEDDGPRGPVQCQSS